LTEPGSGTFSNTSSNRKVLKPPLQASPGKAKTMEKEIDEEEIDVEASQKAEKPKLEKKVSIEGPPRNRRDTLNLHRNFHNLNPDYDIRKFNRIKAIQTFYEKKLGEALKEKVEIQARKDFNDFLASGGKLTYEQIRNLNSVYKQDYVKALLKEDD
jgi:hypothetical protein